MGGLFLLGGVAGLLIFSLPVVLVIGLLTILVLRRDDDADGNRAPALYGAVIAMIGILTLLFAVTGVVSSVADLTADDSSAAISTPSMPGGEDLSFDDSRRRDDDDAAISSAVGLLIVAGVSLGLLRAHRRLFARRHEVVGSARRVYRGYLLVLCLVTAVTAMVAAGVGLYTIYSAIFPDTAGADNRADELRSLVTIAVLFVGAAGLWRWHWRELDLGEQPEVSAAAAP